MDIARARILLESTHDAATAVDVERAVLTNGLAECHQLAGWVEAQRLLIVAALDARADSCPQNDVATASRTSLRQGQKVNDRAAAAGAMPELGQALACGDINTGHLDTAAATLGKATPEQRLQLEQGSARWAIAAKNMSNGEFRKFTDRELRAVQTAEDESARFERQKRDCRLNMWTDPLTGMVCGRFRFDPETGARLLGKIGNTVEAMFHDRQPDTCPADPIERQHHLQALALMALVDGKGVSSGRAEVIVVIDYETLCNQVHDNTIVDVSAGVDLGAETIRRMACDADIIPVVLGTDGVVLDMGRRARLATADQRRALRVIYPTCFIPGCDTPFDKCTVHHLDPWDPHGTTDLTNLRPTCSRHHHALHEGGWTIQHNGWHDTITQPDGTRIHAGPPRARAG